MGSRGPGPRRRGPPDFENPKKLSHKNAIKINFSEKWGKIGLLAPPDVWSSRGPCEDYIVSFTKFRLLGKGLNEMIFFHQLLLSPGHSRRVLQLLIVAPSIVFS